MSGYATSMGKIFQCFLYWLGKIHSRNRKQAWHVKHRSFNIDNWLLGYEKATAKMGSTESIMATKPWETKSQKCHQKLEIQQSHCADNQGDFRWNVGTWVGAWGKKKEVRECGGNFMVNSWATLESAIKWHWSSYYLLMLKWLMEAGGGESLLLSSQLSITHHCLPDSKEITGMTLILSITEHIIKLVAWHWETITTTVYSTQDKHLLPY